CERLSRFDNTVRIVHMEDNEDELVRSFLGPYAYQRALMSADGAGIPDSLTHPLSGRRFLRASDGVTMLMAAMGELIPPDLPVCVIWPAADDRVYYPRANRGVVRAKYDLCREAVILVYTGNTHPANFREVRSLYLSIHLLNRRGIPARLVRTGTNVFGFDPTYQEWANRYALSLGYLESRRELGELLAMADLLVQPGKDDAFNRYRFPSKLPEYFASGRPVVLPRTNIGCVTRHLEDAYVLPNADGPAIANAVEQLVGDPALSVRLAEGARAFYTANFSWSSSASRLVQFYVEVIARKSKGRS
ncbi:MAG TPA: glycosyltransferase, partial [Lacipirellulaceae bacterium]|nr:glycosyltransferase [Lacipirellulaceae bacterium]